MYHSLCISRADKDIARFDEFGECYEYAKAESEVCCWSSGFSIDL
jgi:hypothetical protein